MGPLILDRQLEPATLFTGLELLPVLSGGSLWALERGIIFTDRRLGSIVLDFKQGVKAAEIYRYTLKSTGQQRILVVFTLGEGLVPFGIFETTLSPSPRLLGFECDGEDRRIWSQEVVETWKSSLTAMGVPVSFVDGLPSEFKNFVEKFYDHGPNNTDQQSQDFLDRYQAHDAMHHQLKPHPSSSSVKSIDEEIVNAADVHIFVGQPGCDKRRMVEELLSLSAGSGKEWCLVSYYNSKDAGSIDSGALADQIMSVFTAANSEKKQKHVALVISTYASVADVAKVICFHPRIVRTLRLKCITGIINAGSYFVPGGGKWGCSLGGDRFAVGHCISGFVSHVVIVNSEQVIDFLFDL
jgi:hypothetical protein